VGRLLLVHAVEEHRDDAVLPRVEVPHVGGSSFNFQSAAADSDAIHIDLPGLEIVAGADRQRRARWGQAVVRSWKPDERVEL
jgi:hypothetical protein